MKKKTRGFISLKIKVTSTASLSSDFEAPRHKEYYSAVSIPVPVSALHSASRYNQRLISGLRSQQQCDVVYTIISNEIRFFSFLNKI